MVEKDGNVVGGCGVAPLENADASVCELQKCILLLKSEEQVMPKKSLKMFMEFAKNKGFEICYLEIL